MNLQNTPQAYRKGAIGALMDEYERAASELTRLVTRINEKDYARVVDTVTKDDDCRSVQTIMSHVVRACYGYADSIRKAFSASTASPTRKMLSHAEALEQLDAALGYTAETLAGKWEMSDEEIKGTIIRAGWGVTYDVEQFLEHAIVHILRHRRQLEKFIAQDLIVAPANFNSSSQTN
jgi:uncharacterized damage-inducible protein DinB